MPRSKNESKWILASAQHGLCPISFAMFFDTMVVKNQHHAPHAARMYALSVAVQAQPSLAQGLFEFNTTMYIEPLYLEDYQDNEGGHARLDRAKRLSAIGQNLPEIEDRASTLASYRVFYSLPSFVLIMPKTCGIHRFSSSVGSQSSLPAQRKHYCSPLGSYSCLIARSLQ